ncbi:hypothetical protein L3N51_00548 [Metallosphaera sp. J1]|uniref:hypothetical protein n=1 Tax=Metallosphaera TaxID=41980 RepID=UPI001EE0A150|nr:hypothetical protein [Metallosphaera javensis (ex Hofmann et al. 2022)]MCG3108267.1 hypothetical protein [Metallosphaera javensis (ex Hofmann et al. 2022)]BCS93853.1 MAG: hypothetical protein MjAS7_2461 [Metallosphaera javensis (ex Sakai et al. 2022)]
MTPISGITETGIISLIVAFVLGLLIGFLIKNVIKVGIIILAIIIILIAVGAITPTSVEHALMSLGQTATQAESKVSAYLDLLPYNSIAFIIGLVIGLVKG